MEELTEVITATEFHPTHCNQFMYSSSKSNIKLADMRESALCDRHAKCQSDPHLQIKLSPLFPCSYPLQASRKRKTHQLGHSSPRSSRRSQMSSSAMMGGTFSHET